MSAHALDSDYRWRMCRKAWLSNVKLYLVWSGIYWLFLMPMWYSKGLLNGAFLLDQLRHLLIDTGSYYHFWYLIALIYAVPLMYWLFGRTDRMLLGMVMLLWPVRCVQYTYRWLPWGDVLPWDTAWFDTLFDVVFCAIPMLAVGILCCRHHKRQSTKQWAMYTAVGFVLNMTELMTLYFCAPHTGHFEFLLTTPFGVFCLINCLLNVELSFAHRWIPLAMRQASVWIYCIHPMLIAAFGYYVDDSMGVRRFVVVLGLCLLSAVLYVYLKQHRKRNFKKR